MSIFSRKFEKTFLISLSVLLFLILVLLAVIGLILNSTNLKDHAEIMGQRVVFSISEEKIISKVPDIKFNKIPVKALSDYDTKKDLEINEINEVNEPIFENNINDLSKNNSSKEDTRPAIAIIVYGLGLSKSSTLRAIELPKNVTLGFSPYSYNIDKFSNDSINKGHEILINLPLEPIEYPVDDPGPYALISELSNEENLKRLNFILNQIKDVQGIYTIEDEKFTRSVFGTKKILNVLKDVNKVFVYGLGAKNTVILQLAEQIHYPLLVNNLVIDRVISETSINENLFRLEQIAKTNGLAIGMANPYPITMDIIEDWSQSLDNKGLKLVTISHANKILYDKIYGNVKKVEN